MSSTNVLSGKTAVVTGGNRGIGRAIVLRLAASGASVVVAAREFDSAQAVADEATAGGGRATAAVCDVASEKSISHLAGQVLTDIGVPDVVIANAGVAGPTAPMEDISLEEWRACLGVDLDGVFLTFNAFLPALKKRGQGGSLIAISSITGKRPLAGRTPYAAAKMGVIGLVRSLAQEVGPDGIRVNAICPGAVDGPRVEAVFEGQAASQGISVAAAREQFVAPAALRRLVQDAEVGDACVFLASDAAAAITGEDLNVAAGLVMY